MSKTIWLCSPASRAQWTWAPFVLGPCFELLEIIREVRKRVLLDLRGEVTQLLPFRDAVCLAIAFEPEIP